MTNEEQNEKTKDYMKWLVTKAKDNKEKAQMFYDIFIKKDGEK